MKSKTIALFGGGPACLIAAMELSHKYNVHLYEKGKAVGRKFLVAGNGGFNLTNAAVGSDLLKVYSDNAIIKNALHAFDSNATRRWLNELGIETYVGSSNRVFPKKGITPAMVLKQIKDRLCKQGVVFHFHSEFVGFSSENKPIVLRQNKKEEVIEATHYIFGLGGGSWKKTGANSKWQDYFQKIGVKSMPFQSSNCGVEVEWLPSFAEQFNGIPLKNIQLSTNNTFCKGEALITRYGLEGNAVYPLIPKLRAQLKQQQKASLCIDFKPNNTHNDLIGKVTATTKPKNYRYLLNLNKAVFNLTKNTLSKSSFFDPLTFARQLKNVPLTVTGLRPIDEAISTIGGISCSEVNENFQLKKHNHISVVGEMLDWDAPTGGYLLQACFASGIKAAKILT